MFEREIGGCNAPVRVQARFKYCCTYIPNVMAATKVVPEFTGLDFLKLDVVFTNDL